MFTGSINIEAAWFNFKGAAVVAFKDPLTVTIDNSGFPVIYKMVFRGAPNSSQSFTYQGIYGYDNCNKAFQLRSSSGSAQDFRCSPDISLNNGLVNFGDDPTDKHTCHSGRGWTDGKTDTGTFAGSGPVTIRFTLNDQGEKVIYAMGGVPEGDGHDHGLAVTLSYKHANAKLINRCTNSSGSNVVEVSYN